MKLMDLFPKVAKIKMSPKRVLKSKKPPKARTRIIKMKVTKIEKFNKSFEKIIEVYIEGVKLGLYFYEQYKSINSSKDSYIE